MAADVEARSVAALVAWRGNRFEIAVENNNLFAPSSQFCYFSSQVCSSRVCGGYNDGNHLNNLPLTVAAVNHMQLAGGSVDQYPLNRWYGICCCIFVVVGGQCNHPLLAFSFELAIVAKPVGQLAFISSNKALQFVNVLVCRCSLKQFVSAGRAAGFMQMQRS